VGRHRQPAQAEQVGAAVGIGLNFSRTATKRRTQQEPPSLLTALCSTSSRRAINIELAVPSTVFTAIFPVKPSQTDNIGRMLEQQPALGVAGES